MIGPGEGLRPAPSPLPSGRRERDVPRVRNPHSRDFDQLAARFHLLLRHRREPSTNEPNDHGGAKTVRRE
jgi:hypothetical protein